jgi:biotin transport system substrate-specific component
VKRFQEGDVYLNKFVNISLTVALAVMTGILAQVSFHIGPIPYTMQNLGVMLSGLLLQPRYALASQLLYILLIALGLPLASGLRGGVAVLLGYTGGYIAMFPIASFLMSILTRAYLKSRSKTLVNLNRIDTAVLLGLSFISTLPVYLFGFLVFARYALENHSLYSWSINVSSFVHFYTNSKLTPLFIASVLVFIPQDLFVDNLLAIVLSKNIAKLIESRGLRIE